MEDSEWNDALRAHNILPPKPTKEVVITEDALIDLVEAAVTSKTRGVSLEDASLDELDELEDEEDDRVLEMYRRKRMAELQEMAATEKYRELYHISEQDFVCEVSETSKNCWVVCHLFRDSIPACKLLNAHLAVLADRYRATKFVKIVGDQCIHGYPDRNMPTLLIYNEGDVKQQIVGISNIPGGARCTVGGIETLLMKTGAIKTKGSFTSDERTDPDEENSDCSDD